MTNRKTLLAALLAAASTTATAGETTPSDDPLLDRSRWQIYLSYAQPTEIACQSADSIWVLASKGLYLYLPQQQAIRYQNKLTGLSDTGIQHIAWNRETHGLLVVYDNSNIDIVRQPRGDSLLHVTNMPGYYSYATSLDKTVNRITTHGRLAYLATNFGVMAIDMGGQVFLETYRLDRSVTDVQVADNTIWALCKSGVALKAPLDANLMNPATWQQATPPTGLLGQTPADWTAHQAQVKALQVEGPLYNNFGRVRWKDGKLLTVGGGYTWYREDRLPGTPQVYWPQERRWQVYDEQVDTLTGVKYIDMTDIDEDPLRPGHVYSSGRTGLYEWQDGHLVRHYGYLTSPLGTALGPESQSKPHYVLVETICYDRRGLLWVTNSITKDGKNLYTLSPDHDWRLYEGVLDMHHGDDGYMSAMFDSRGMLWMNNNHFSNSATFGIDVSDTANVRTLCVLNDNMVNQFQTKLSDAYRNCVAEDSTHNIWIGTQSGIFLVEADRCQQQHNLVTQPVLGEGLVGQKDFFMQGQNIMSIVADHDGHLWIASGGAGLYMIDPVELTQLEHFTSANSPLLSDNIETMDYDRATGLLYIGTSSGLCSFDTGSATGSQTGISAPKATQAHGGDRHYYSLSGQQLPARPTQPGIYIHRGRKTVIR